MDFLWELYKQSPIYKTDDYEKLRKDLILDKDAIIGAVDMVIVDYDLKIKLQKELIKNVRKTR